MLAECLSAGRENVEMRFGIYQKITILLVVNERQAFRVVKRRIADFVFRNAKIVMQKNADFARRVAQIADARAPQKNIFVTSDRIVADDFNAEFFTD